MKNKIEINTYPFNKDCAFAITLDDLHPEGKEDMEKLDFGKDFNGSFWKRIDAVIRDHPAIKFTLFTPLAWTDRSNFPDGLFWPLRKIYSKRRSYLDGFNLTHKDYSGWAESMKKKISNGNIFLGYHGLTHHNNNNKYAASQEFLGLSKSIVDDRLSSMFTLAKNSGLPFESGFRSPGWGTNDQLTKQLENKGIIYTANSTDFSSPLSSIAKGAGIKNQRIMNENYLSDNLVNFTANCYPKNVSRAVEIARSKGIIIIHAHVARTIFGLEFVDQQFQKNINSIVNEIRDQTLSHIWYASLGEMAEFFMAKKQVKVIKKSENEVIIKNPSKYSLDGLTLKINNMPYVLPCIKPMKEHILKLDSNEDSKKVSIVLTVFNGEKNVLESLKSLAAQTYKNIEIVVVNDGSRDNTEKIVKEYIAASGDKRIRILTQKNGGRSNARNNGFLMSSGKIITFCEDDAMYDKDYVLQAVKHFEGTSKKLGGVIGPHYVWNRNESFNTRAKDLERRRNFYNYTAKSCWFYTSSLFREIGMFDENLELVEDVAPALLLQKKGYKFIFEKQAMWLHKEPSNIKLYLRRKFRGGIGMALLQKTKLRSSIVPPKILLALSMLTLLSIIILIKSLMFIIPLVLMGLVLAFSIRLKDFQLSRKLSNEAPLLIVSSLYLEYIWWASTFLGYIYGLTMKTDTINKYLKGR